MIAFILSTMFLLATCGGSAGGSVFSSVIKAPAAAPSLATIVPASGPIAGGTAVDISGANFQKGATSIVGGTNLQSGAAVTFGGIDATSVSFVSGSEIRATTPAGSPGTVDVTVTNPDGQTATLSGSFTYTTSNKAPTIASITPDTGPNAGGTQVVITGSNFQNGSAVTFGGVAAASVTFVTTTDLEAATPPGNAGTVDVDVTNPDGQTATLAGGFTYKTSSTAPAISGITPNAGPAAGGTQVVITGSNFQNGSAVTFGGVAAASVTFVTTTDLEATTPAGNAGTVDVDVTNPDGQTATLAGGFTYKTSSTAPAISGITPNAGPTAGGTQVVITGSNFQNGSAVTFGGVAAASVTFVSSAQLNATTPLGNAGTVNVAATNPDGQTATLAGAFTYSNSESGLSGSPGATATQYVLTYTASTNKMCTIEVSKNSSFTPLVHAVDPSLFPGSDEDGETNIGQRTFVVGERTIAAETDAAPSITVGMGNATRTPLKYDGYTVGQVTVAYAGHPFVAGNNIIVSGMSDSSFDSTWARVMSVSANSFTYWTPDTSAGTSGGGTITRSDHYSLALENNTTYYYRIGGPANSCGASPSTGTFTTMNWPNGDTFAEAFPTDTKGNFITPTIFETHDVTKNAVIDPYTGTLLRPLSLWSDTRTDDFASYTGGQDHCSMQVDSNGFYHCYTLWEGGVVALWGIDPGTGESRYLGTFVGKSSVCPNTAYISGVVNSVWDASDPNKVYGVCPNSSGSSNIFSMTYTGNDAAVSPGTLTTVSGPVQIGSGSLQAMVQAFNPSFKAAIFPGGTIEGVEGNDLSIVIARGSQGSPAWLVHFNVATDTVVAATSSWNAGEGATCAGAACTNFPPTRWCGVHSAFGLGDPDGGWGDYSLTGPIEAQGNMQMTLNETSGLNGTDSTDTIAVTSNIIGTLGSPGDPAGVKPFPDGSNWMDEARPGDIFQFGDGTSEYVMVIARNSATSLTIARGCHQGPADYPVCDGTREASHANGAVLNAVCWPFNNNSLEALWNFAGDPHGQDTSGNLLFPDYYFFGGHGGSELPWAVGEAWQIKSSSIWDTAFFKKKADYYITEQPSFGGDLSLCNSAGCYSYPHYFPASPSTVNWAWDTNYYYGGVSNDTASLVQGTTYIYKYKFGNSPLHTFYPNLPYWSVESKHWMTDISAPGATLTNTAADNWKYCVARVAGECWTGSQPGDVYGNLNIASPNPPTLACSPGFAYDSVGPGWCVDNAKAAGNGLIQVGLSPDSRVGTNSNNGKPIYGFGNSRKLVQGLFGPPGHAVAHPQDLPDQSWAYFGSAIANPYVMTVQPSAPDSDIQTYLAKIPPLPPDDGIDRTTYESVPVSIGAGSNGATHARVKYGYQEDGPKNDFYCTQYKKTCYYSNQSLPLNGTINLPVGIPQRVIFYQVEYLDNSNTVVASGPVTAYAIP